MDLYDMKYEFQESIRNQTHFSTKLAIHLLTNKFPDTNVFFSPLSFHVILSLTAAGSKDQTLDQILGFLKVNSTDELNSFYSQLVPLILTDGCQNGGPEFSFANGVWFEKTLSLKRSFNQMVRKVYKTTCNKADFVNKSDEVARKVNLWVEKHTNGVIKEALPADAVDSLTRLIFANAIYFKGEWRQTFERSKTEVSNFHLLDGGKVRIPFMTSENKQIVEEYDDFKVLGLPYIHGQDKRRLIMYMILPDAKDGIQALVEKIGTMPDFFNYMPTREVELGKFLIPKFKILFGFEGSDMLKELGLVLPFSVEDGLTEMVDSSRGQNLYVSSIHHKSFVEVNEEGTEVAVSLMETQRYASRVKKKPKKVDFVADHPFLFVISEDITGIVLFMGQVIDPSAG